MLSRGRRRMSHGRKLISFLGHTKSSREALAAEVGWWVVGDALWADRLLPVGHAPPSWDTPRLLEHAPPLGTRPASRDTPRLPRHAPLRSCLLLYHPRAASIGHAALGISTFFLRDIFILYFLTQLTVLRKLSMWR